MAGANRLQALRLCQPLCGSWAVIEVGSFYRPGQDTAVVDTSDDHPDLPLGTQRHQFGKCALIQECVATSHQKAVQVRLTREPRKHLRLIHARPNCLDNPRRPQHVQRHVPITTRLVPVVVRVMQVEDIDFDHPHPGQTFIQRLHDAVKRVVKHGLSVRPGRWSEKPAYLGRDNTILRLE